MKKISAEIVADSISEKGYRITTFLLTYPRMIHSELMTHRMFSRNSASSRAIPFEKMVKMVKEDPFIPIAWQFDHKGMQGIEYVTEESDFGGISARNESWLSARDYAIQQAKDLNSMDTTKQLCNRILEPFMWHTVLVTATEWENFFELRCPKYHTPVSGDGFYFKSKKDCIANHSNPINLKKLEDMSDIEWLQINSSQAEIHIQALAEAMWDAMNESEPKELKSGEWHIPFGDKFNGEKLYNTVNDLGLNGNDSYVMQKARLKISTARCARLSYMTFDGEIDYEKDIKLHDQLLASRHASPFEHCCRVLTDKEYENSGKLIVLENGIIDFQKGWVDNFRGYKSYRRILNFS